MEEEEKKEIQQETAAPQSRKGELLDLLSSEIPDFNREDDEAWYGQAADHIKKGRDQLQKLAEALQKNPQLAAVISDVVNGKRTAGASLARYFGKDLLTAEEGTPEYDEIVAAEKERREEVDKYAAKDAEYKKNMEASSPIIDEWCKRNGLDKDEFLGKVWDNIVSPIFDGVYTDALLDILNNALNYDKDTEAARQAGVIEGRNQNINSMRGDSDGDGMPKGFTSATPKPSPVKQKGNSILDLAQEA